MDVSALTFRPAVAADAFTLAVLLDDEQSTRLAQLPFSGSLADCERFLARRAAGAGLTYLVLSDAEPIGYASLTPRDESEAVELAFALTECWRGQGLGVWLVRGLVRLAAEHWQGWTPFARCRPDNARAQASLQRAGFAREAADDEHVAVWRCVS